VPLFLRVRLAEDVKEIQTVKRAVFAADGERDVGALGFLMIA
jgi:hypothetical protein